MVCSACGQACPTGDRFCGRCGTPLPHRPLNTPGAQGTMNLARGPLEGSSSHLHQYTAAMSDRFRVGSTACAIDEPGDEAPPAVPALSQTTPDLSSSNTEQPSLSDLPPRQNPQFSSDFAPTAESASAAPVRLGETLDHPVLDHLDDANATPESPATQPNVSDFLDALVASPAEPSTHEEAPHFSWMDDVLEQIEREAAKSSEAREEPPRFLNELGDLSLPPFKPDDPPAIVASESTSVAADPAKTIAIAGAAEEARKSPSTKRHLWQAVVAALVLVALASVQWRSQIIRTFQLSYDRIQALISGDEPDANGTPIADSADPSPPSQSVQSGAEVKTPNQNGAPNANPEARVAGEPQASPKPAPTNPAPQETGPPRENQQAASVQKKVPGSQEVARAENSRATYSKSVWLWKATARGNPDAPVQLADLYIKGDGVPRSCEQALVLLKTAALKDNVRACNRLAFLYSVGICTRRSRVQAYRWLHAALTVEPNNQWAQQNRDLIFQQMTPEEKTLTQQYRQPAPR